MLLDAGAERGASGRVIFHGHEPRAPRFPEWCASGTTAVLAHGVHDVLRNSERFSAGAVLAVGWLERLLRPSQLGVHIQPAIVWRDVKQGCVATPRRVIQHIPGEDNHWGDLLSRWRMLDSEGPLVRANVIAVAAPPTGDYQVPSKGEIKDRQDAVARGQVEVATPLGTVTRGEDGVYRVSYQGRMVMWVPEEEPELQARLMVCAHMQDAEHSGVRATTHRLAAYGAWDNTPVSTLHRFESGQRYATSAGRSSAWYGSG